MSSPSSSDDCDYCQCFDDNDYGRYGRASENSRHMPFGNTGQPLIYFAQFQRVNKKQKKENRNCFVKAFKWYTQEREPDHKYCTALPPERIGFANWLDVKYFEYLKERNGLYQINALPGSITRPCSKLNCPKKKRRRPSKDAGDVPDKNNTNQSCEFIMQPKDITRAASECCYQTASVSSDKGVVKSSSVSTVSCETKVPKRIDVIPQEGLPRLDMPCCACATHGKPKPRSEQSHQVPSKNQMVDVACQNSGEVLTRTNAQTQYETEKRDTPCLTESYACCICTPTPEVVPSSTNTKQDRAKLRKLGVLSPKHKLKKAARLDADRPQSSICYCPNSNILTQDFESQYPSNAVVLHVQDNDPPPPQFAQENKLAYRPITVINRQSTEITVCRPGVKQVITARATTSSQTCCASNICQTSDHAISLDHIKCPMFVKLVCVDKLKIERNSD